MKTESSPLPAVPTLQFMGINFKKQSVRREVVAALYGGLFCMLVCIRLYAGSHRIAWLTGSLLFGSIIACGWWMLNQFALLYCGQGEARGRQIDERQIALRDRAFFRAYQWICGLLGLFMLSWYIATDEPRLRLWYPHTSGDFNLLFWAFLAISVTLPHSFLAWWEEDLLDESE